MREVYRIYHACHDGDAVVWEPYGLYAEEVVARVEIECLAQEEGTDFPIRLYRALEGADSGDDLHPAGTLLHEQGLTLEEWERREDDEAVRLMGVTRAEFDAMSAQEQAELRNGPLGEPTHDPAPSAAMPTLELTENERDALADHAYRIGLAAGTLRGLPVIAMFAAIARTGIDSGDVDDLIDLLALLSHERWTGAAYDVLRARGLDPFEDVSPGLSRAHAFEQDGIAAIRKGIGA